MDASSPTGPMKPGGPMRAAISSSLAGRHPVGSIPASSCLRPRALASLISFTRWSPRTTTIASASSPITTGNAFSSAPAGTPSAADTWATVTSPGVETSSGASGAGGRSTGPGSALATSTLAA